MDNNNYNFVRVTKYDDGKIDVELCFEHDSIDEVKRAIDKDIFFEKELSNGRLNAKRVGCGGYQFETRDDEQQCIIVRSVLSMNNDLFRLQIR